MSEYFFLLAACCFACFLLVEVSCSFRSRSWILFPAHRFAQRRGEVLVNCFHFQCMLNCLLVFVLFCFVLVWFGFVQSPSSEMSLRNGGRFFSYGILVNLRVFLKYAELHAASRLLFLVSFSRFFPFVSEILLRHIYSNTSFA